MTDHAWQQQNLAAIQRRLAWLRRLPDGAIYDEASGLQHIRILKHGSQIQLYFVDRASGALEGPMSRIDIERPLDLLAGYTQAALLSLIWQPNPRRICVLGFAGGRLALVLHHYLPGATIDNVDHDPAFTAIAPAFFGIGFDERQRLTIADGRQFLAGTDATYAIIVVDAFSDSGDQLDHLATAQFYELCARRLAPGGVLCANILRSDPHHAAKIKSLAAQFPAAQFAELKRSIVAFGAYQRLPATEVGRRAAELQRRHGFGFPFLARAAELHALRAARAELQQQIRHATPLEDPEID
jgi:spermidine synthase